MDVNFTILADPQGKARPRVTKNKYTGKSHTYTPDKTVFYEELVRASYSKAVKGKLAENYSDKPLYVSIEACFAIPKSTSLKKFAEMIKGNILPTKKPDCDNIAKIILDALNNVAFKDDSQVVCLVVSKRYTELPSVNVHISEIDYGK